MCRLRICLISSRLTIGNALDRLENRLRRPASDDHTIGKLLHGRIDCVLTFYYDIWISRRSLGR